MKSIAPLSLRTLMAQRGVTRQEIADACAVTERAVRGWEARERTMGADVLAVVARRLELAPPESDALLRWAGGEDEPG